MKKIYFLLVMSVFCVYPIVAQETIITDTLTIEESDSMDLFFLDDHFLLDTTESAMPRVRRKAPSTVSYTHSVAYSVGNSTSSIGVLIIIRKSLFDDSTVKYRVIRHAEDLCYALHTNVIIETVTNEYYTDIKALLKYYYQRGLQGAILVGDINFAYFEQDYLGWYKDTTALIGKVYESRYSNWPCDLYYADLDGEWKDKDENGLFDKHKGDVEPDIFLGRLQINPKKSTDVDMLKEYLDKNHRYWIGDIPMREKRALGYINEDWVDSKKLKGINLLYGSSNYSYIQYGDPGFGRDDYLTCITSNQYEFVQLAAHSAYYYHSFPDSKYVTTGDLATKVMDPLAYNLFCCSACNWVKSLADATIPEYYDADDFLGGAYIFNRGNGLSVVGSTKTGSMLQFKYFYQPLSEGKTIGKALHKWWHDYCGGYHTKQEIHWFYGLTIIGDPFVMMKYNTITICQDVLTLSSFDNSNPSKLHYYRAQERIEVGGNYVIPVGKHVIFDAPEVVFLSGFQCPVGATFETRTEGCICNQTATKRGIMQWQNEETEESIETNIELMTNLQVYPNPVQDILQITSSEPIETIAVYTLSGEKVLQATTTQVDVSNLKEGMYIVHTTSQTGSHYTAKVVKQ